jgi:glyoxylase-like metal-dependent hydrolase (beta-lactamase superfamily II)
VSAIHESAPILVRKLRELNAFPPDIIVLTHSHFEHSQGVNYIRREAEKEGIAVEVRASYEGIPLLEDQSYNKVFDPKGTYENITGVTPIKEGERLDLDGLRLEIFDVPGHSKDSLAIYDEVNGNIFVGDSIGLKTGDRAFVPSFMPPAWDTDSYYSSVDKLRQIDFQGVCLGHFGFIYGDEAKNILDESVSAFESWWNVYEDADRLGKLDDAEYIVGRLKTELNVQVPKYKLLKSGQRFMLGMMNALGGLIGRAPVKVGDILFRDNVAVWLAQGYRNYKGMT